MYNYPSNNLTHTDGDKLEIGGGMLKLSRGQERYEIPYRDIGGGSPPAPVTGGNVAMSTVSVTFSNLTTGTPKHSTVQLTAPAGFSGATPYLIGTLQDPKGFVTKPVIVFQMQNLGEGDYRFSACAPLTSSTFTEITMTCYIMWVKE